MSDGPVTSNSASDGPGAALAKAREAADITQREVSDALNLSVSTIDAIEQDDRDHLPADVFTRGYIRAYARLLQLDPGPLVAAFGGSVDSQDAATPFADAAASERNINRVSIRGISVRLPPGVTPARLMAAGGVFLLLIILAIWFFSGETPAEADNNQMSQAATAAEQPGDIASAAPQVANNTTRTAAAEPVQSAFTPEAPTADEAQTLSDAVVQVAQASEPGRQTGEPQPGSEPAVEVEGQVQSITPPGVRRLTAEGGDRLSIEFTEECWVEIKDPEGNLLYGNLGRPGTQLAFVGAAPFRVLLGYAPGAMLKYNGEPVALGPHTRNNVASLVLGQ